MVRIRSGFHLSPEEHYVKAEQILTKVYRARAIDIAYTGMQEDVALAQVHATLACEKVHKSTHNSSIGFMGRLTHKLKALKVKGGSKED